MTWLVILLLYCLYLPWKKAFEEVGQKFGLSRISAGEDSLHQWLPQGHESERSCPDPDPSHSHSQDVVGEILQIHPGGK
jgi:hypothetical protein